MSFAFVFPGQGSQSVGMLGELAGVSPAVRATFAEAAEFLRYDLWKLVSEGPAEALNATERTQPAMLAAGVATWRAWQEEGGGVPAVLSGHSLGEFTALVCAGALDFAAALELVRFRGESMQEAVPAGSGAMAAILGLEDEAVVAACAEAAHGRWSSQPTSTPPARSSLRASPPRWSAPWRPPARAVPSAPCCCR